MNQFEKNLLLLENSEDIDQDIKKLESAKMTYDELAEKYNINKTHISRILKHILGDRYAEFSNNKKQSLTQKTLKARYGEHITNAAQTFVSKNNTKRKLQESQLSEIDQIDYNTQTAHQIFNFNKLPEYETARILNDLICKEGYRAKDILLISDFESVKDISSINQKYNQITQLRRVDYNKLIEMQSNKLKNLPVHSLNKMHDEILTGKFNQLEFSKIYNIPYSMITPVSRNVFEDSDYIWAKSASTRAAVKNKKINYQNFILNLENNKKLQQLLYEIDLNQSEEKIFYDIYMFRKNVSISSLYQRYIDLFKEKDFYPNGFIHSNNIFYVSQNKAIALEKENLINIDHESLRLSTWERKIYHLLKENNINFEKNIKSLLTDTKCQGQELDFYLNDFNIAFEINPSYTHHSNEYMLHHLGGSKPKNYHYNKYKACQKKEIKLISLFENDLQYDIFENKTWPRLKNILNIDVEKIGARNVNIIESKSQKDKKEARDFLDQYHLQDAGQAKIYYQIRRKNNNELIGVFSFGKPAASSYHEFIELKRMCFKHDIRIIGCISKVIKRLQSDYGYNKILTYSDNNFGDGKGYEKAGFKFIKETGPSLKYMARCNPEDTYSWSINTPWGATSGVVADDRISKNLPVYSEENFNIAEYIEKELSHKNKTGKGYDKIYTCGSKLWMLDSQ